MLQHFWSFSPIFCSIDLDTKKINKGLFHKHDFSNFNNKYFSEQLEKIDMSQFESNNSDNVLELFYNKIIDILDNLAPYKPVTKKE